MDRGNRMQEIEIIGAGVVGEALGGSLQKQGFSVHFVDVDLRKIEQLRQQGQRAFLPTDPASADVFFICVPTPSVNEKADYSQIVEAARCIGEKLRDHDAYAVVIVKSTVLPGTTE